MYMLFNPSYHLIRLIHLLLIFLFYRRRNKGKNSLSYLLKICNISLIESEFKTRVLNPNLNHSTLLPLDQSSSLKYLKKRQFL